MRNFLTGAAAQRVLYPVTYIATTSSLTVLLICVGVLGNATLAADLAVAQGAVIATFYAFSANARNLILQSDAAHRASDLLLARLAFLVPLCALSYFLSAGVAAVPHALAGAVTARRACEWLGEVHLSAIERDADRQGVRAYFAIQCIALAALVFVLVAAPDSLVPALWIWAAAPLLGGTRLLRLSGTSLGRLLPTLRMLVPHAGSTLIIGIAIYLLRVIIVLVTDREFAGLLFTAIAIGSFAGTLFANVLGPSFALRAGARGLPPALALVLGGLTALGGVMVLAAGWLPGKPAFFWEATGFSLIGSVIMIEAQRIRLRLFQSSRGDELFGPDVLRNLTLMIAAPAMVVMFGRTSLAGVYVLDAMLTWLFYVGAYKHAASQTWVPKRAEVWLQVALAVLVVFPLFIQLKGDVYHSVTPVLDSGGRILDLPLPVSLAACFLGTLLLARFSQASLGMGAIFFFFVAMALTSVIAAGGQFDYGSRKLLLLLQFLLPSFALVLGLMYSAGTRDETVLARSFLYFVAVFVPLQLALTWIQGQHVLTHNIGLFSIYQHRQYVPVVFVGAYLVPLFALWESRPERWLALSLMPFMAVYAAVSYSTLALGMLVIGACTLAIRLRRLKLGLAILVALAAAVAAAMWQLRNTVEFVDKYVPTEVHLHRADVPASTTGLPVNVTARMHDWKKYGSGVLESGKTFLVGHREAFERSESSSAHNYYLDLLYNFGVIAFLPLLVLIAYTAMLIARRPQVLSDPATLGFVLVVAFLVLVDNNFKVNLRQPYPGVFSFFVWGVLLTRLLRAEPAVRPG